jgi:hypothetical protein
MWVKNLRPTENPKLHNLSSLHTKASVLMSGALDYNHRYDLQESSRIIT